MSQVDLLYRLQQIDIEIRHKKQRLGEVLQAQKENAELTAARQAEAAASGELRRWRGRQNELNQELDTLNARAKRSEDRLYSGNVKNPKELADLQLEIEALGRRRSDLEDEILEAMIHVEESQTVYEESSSHLAQVETEWEATLGSLREEQMALATRLNELMSLRQEQVRRIEPQSLRLYENVGKRRGGVAVAGLKINMCTGCQVTLPANLVKAAREGGLVNCSNCGRILNPV